MRNRWHETKVIGIYINLTDSIPFSLKKILIDCSWTHVGQHGLTYTMLNPGSIIVLILIRASRNISSFTCGLNSNYWSQIKMLFYSSSCSIITHHDITVPQQDIGKCHRARYIDNHSFSDLVVAACNWSGVGMVWVYPWACSALSGYEQEGRDKQRVIRVPLGVSTDRSRFVVEDSPWALSPCLHSPNWGPYPDFQTSCHK